MKKRGAALLFCLLLVLQLAVPVRAAGSVYFVAAEASVLPLTDATMPFWSGGYLYVPASVFTGFDISIINNTAKKMTVLEKDRRALLFDWEKGTAQDGGGQVLTPGLIQSGGSVFVPASIVSDFFGLQYSVTEVAHGYLVWLRSPNFGMTAADFVNAATYNMEERYTAYTKGSQTPSTPQTPSGTTVPPSGARIRLCIEADQRAGSLLDALERVNGWATFYCTPEFMENNGDLLRRLAVSGSAVGLLLDPEDPAESLDQQLKRGNDALYRATLTRTRLVYADGGEETLQALEQLGYSCLTPDMDRTDYKLESAANAAALLKRVSARRRDVSVWLGTTASAAGVKEFVSSAQREGHYCRAMTE